MASPLVETKLFTSRLRRGAVSRPRLSSRLRQGAEAKLTLISGPAGFGKTTALAAWPAEPAAIEHWASADRYAASVPFLVQRPLRHQRGA